VQFYFHIILTFPTPTLFFLITTLWDRSVLANSHIKRTHFHPTMKLGVGLHPQHPSWRKTWPQSLLAYCHVVWGWQTKCYPRIQFALFWFGPIFVWYQILLQFKHESFDLHVEFPLRVHFFLGNLFFQKGTTFLRHVLKMFRSVYMFLVECALSIFWCNPSNRPKYTLSSCLSQPFVILV
jgi:hypothetical protein